MSLRTTARRKAWSIRDLTLYLRVKPAPSTLSERRVVLHALQQFGKIDVFKKLYDDSSFISVTRDLTTFLKIRRESPMQFEYQDEQTSEVMPDPRVALPFKTTTTTTPDSGVVASRQTFTVEAFPAHGYSHYKAIKRSPLYGPWPAQTETSLVTSTLRQVIPSGIAARGLADWETGHQMEQDPDARIALLTTKNNNPFWEQRAAKREHKKVMSELATIVGSRDDKDVER